MSKGTHNIFVLVVNYECWLAPANT
jgi:hypothetical protein